VLHIKFSNEVDIVISDYDVEKYYHDFKKWLLDNSERV